MKFEFLCCANDIPPHEHFQHNSTLLQKYIQTKKSCKATCISTQTGLETYTHKTQEVSVFLTHVGGVGGFCLIFHSPQLLKKNFLDCLWQLCLSSHKDAYAIRERKLRGSCWQRARLAQYFNVFHFQGFFWVLWCPVQTLFLSQVTYIHHFLQINLFASIHIHMLTETVNQIPVLSFHPPTWHWPQNYIYLIISFHSISFSHFFPEVNW